MMGVVLACPKANASPQPKPLKTSPIEPEEVLEQHLLTLDHYTVLMSANCIVSVS